MSKPTQIIVTVIGTLAYLALAVLGAGGVEPFFSQPAFIGLTLVLFALAGAALFTEGNLSAGEREDRSNRWVIVAFGVLGLMIGYLPAYSDRIDFWTFGGDVTRWAGVFLFAAGGALRLWPVFVLGPRFSGLVAIQKGHKLVTHGIYSVIRHPSYLGLLISTTGWALAFRSGLGLLLVLLMLFPLIARIHAEERILFSQFGEEYEAYRARTSRLMPGVW